MSDFYNKYPYTDFHELNLDWVIERVKKLTEDWAATLEEWNSTEEQWQELYNYVHDYFDNLDVQEEINNKINAMIADGTFVTITTPVIEAKVASMMPATVASQIGDTVASQIGSTVASQIDGAVAGQIDDAVVSPVNTWLAAHITQPTTPAIDTSLLISGAAADSKVTGTKIEDNKTNNLVDYDKSIFWDEFNTGKKTLRPLLYHGLLSTTNGTFLSDYQLRAICTDFIDGSTISKIYNNSSGLAGIRTFVYDAGNVFQSYITNGNVSEITISDSTKKYRFMVYPMATGGNSDSTFETLNSLIINIRFTSGSDIPYNTIDEINNLQYYADQINYNELRNDHQDIKWGELYTNKFMLNTAFHYGMIDYSTGIPNPDYPLRSIYTDMIDGSDFEKILNKTHGLGGIRVFTYSAAEVFESYSTKGNIAEVTISDTSKKYRFLVYPMATGGNSDSTYDILNSLLNDMYFISSASIHTIYTVASDGSGQFTSIQAAIDSASDGDIIIVKSGTYTENIVNTKQVHVIGENKFTTFIQNYTGEYATPPVWTTQGIWENLSIRALNDGQTIPGQPGFAFHLDSYWSYNIQRACIIRNCIILSEWSDAIGSGIEKNCFIELDNVRCISDHGTACKIHSTAGNNGYNSNVYLNECTFSTKDNSQHGLMIHTAGASADQVNSITIHANNCAMTDFVHYTAPLYYDPMNYNNSAAELNQL